MRHTTLPLAGELRLAALASVFALLSAFTSEAQPLYAQPPNVVGGQIVHEMVPYQPGVLVEGEFDAAPIYLDTCPEFCPPVEAGPPAVVLEEVVEAAPQIPAGFRSGVFQKLFFTGTYIPQFEDDSLGLSELETGIVFGLPFLRVTTPLLITPRFAVRYLDGPSVPDLPPRLHDAEITFRHLRRFGDGPWAMNAAVTLGYYSDFQKNDADAFRVTGQAFAVYESSPATKWVFGVVYLNREDLSIIPAAGVIYEPTPDVKYEAILPRPRIAWRLDGGAPGIGPERWAYLGGEFGGGVWSIQRPLSGMQDRLTYSDFRILVGIERKNFGGIGHRLEAGYIFGRELEFSSTTPDAQLDDSLFVRMGMTY